MSRIPISRWFRLRSAFAIGVLGLLVVELSGYRAWPVVLPQALLIVGIVITSLLDFRELRSKGGAAPGPPA
jgi:hypothetical protein